MANEQLKKIIEALIFVNTQPLKVQQIKEILDQQGLDIELINDIVLEIKQDLDNSDRGFRLVEIAGGWQFMTDPACAEWIKKLNKSTARERLSKPALETLAIIAYRQPVTRADIEFIRGVGVDNMVKNLLDKNLIRIIGRKEVPGRPFLYGTTGQFLQYFALKSLEELPKLPEFSEAEIKLEHDMLIPKQEEVKTENNIEGAQKENEPKELTKKS